MISISSLALFVAILGYIVFAFLLVFLGAEVTDLVESLASEMRELIRELRKQETDAQLVDKKIEEVEEHHG